MTCLAGPPPPASFCPRTTRSLTDVPQNIRKQSSAHIPVRRLGEQLQSTGAAQGNKRRPDQSLPDHERGT